MSAADAIRIAWARAVGAAAPSDVIDDLLARHAEPHRCYHTAEHVAWVLHHVDRLLAVLPASEPERGAITAAALFHDAIYDPRSAENEADSAVLAARQLSRAGWKPEQIDSVAALIIATAGHDATDPSEAILLDADLAILGAPQPQYRAYVEAVRAEYAFVDDARWRTGRAVVLDQFLRRDRIYATGPMSGSRERRARDNLARELSALREGTG